jgi:CTP:molybdopterin cytidylyltransferase MocA
MLLLPARRAAAAVAAAAALAAAGTAAATFAAGLLAFRASARIAAFVGDRPCVTARTLFAPLLISC